MNDFTYASRKQPEFMCLRLVRCAQCDLVYAPSPPDTSFLTSAYADAAYDSAEEAKCAAASYAKALEPYVEHLRSRTAAVDVGAGNGALLGWLRQLGFAQVVGIEPSRAAIDAASDDVRGLLREGMFSPEMLKDVTPSLICSFMTLEHLADPGVFVKTAFELLEPGGMIAVVVHNWQGVLNRSLGLRSPIIDVEHLQLYNPKSVIALLKGAGFEAVDVCPISNSYPMRYWLRLTPLPGTMKAAMGRLLERSALADLKIPLRVGNILAVGTKPSMESA
ncbi:class I SAM-dependent methyltransferase [Noviherbaspirillum cavernae]|uniref:Class I SAM-dependent methyltransferase n=2 Tax=Noviherbaspirillum cavernae TaxID=2320862 RepID=A0A418X5R5_9BURK|nr:class I SAM-dependent methyltransferase [Noviherbaspirillum cavernae]